MWCNLRNPVLVYGALSYILVSSLCHTAHAQNTTLIENMEMTLYGFKGPFDRDPRLVWTYVCSRTIREWYENRTEVDIVPTSIDTKMNSNIDFKYIGNELTLRYQTRFQYNLTTADKEGRYDTPIKIVQEPFLTEKDRMAFIGELRNQEITRNFDDLTAASMPIVKEPDYLPDPTDDDIKDEYFSMELQGVTVDYLDEATLATVANTIVKNSLNFYKGDPTVFDVSMTITPLASGKRSDGVFVVIYTQFVYYRSDRLPMPKASKIVLAPFKSDDFLTQTVADLASRVPGLASVTKNGAIFGEDVGVSKYQSSIAEMYIRVTPVISSRDFGEDILTGKLTREFEGYWTKKRWAAFFDLKVVTSIKSLTENKDYTLIIYEQQYKYNSIFGLNNIDLYTLATEPFKSDEFDQGPFFNSIFGKGPTGAFYQVPFFGTEEENSLYVSRDKDDSFGIKCQLSVSANLFLFLAVLCTVF